MSQKNYQNIKISNDEFIASCQLGDIAHLSYYAEHLFNDMSKDKINEGFFEGCKRGQLNVVRYLLTSKEITQHADIQSGYCRGLLQACTNGHLDIVEYLTTSDELDEKSELFFMNPENNVLKLACKEGKQDIVYFLLTNELVRDKLDFHANKDKNFELLWVNKIENLDFVLMLFKEEIIAVTHDIKKIVKRYRHRKELYATMLEVFETLEFRNKLKKELHSQPEESKRKI